MKVPATITQVERKEVDINPIEFLDSLLKAWKRSIDMQGCDINSKGMWESWTDTGHGSGLTERKREATAEELSIDECFWQLAKLVRENKF